MPQSARTVLVTGGAGDVGAATARLLAGRGWRVVLADRDLPGAASVAAAIEGDDDDDGGGGVRALPLDLADDASIAELADALAGEESLDALVHCAGLAVVRRFAESDPAEWDLLYRVNQRGPMLLTQLLLPRVQESAAGRVVFVSSDGARAGAAGEAAYAATKAALFGLAKCLARECARHAVTVNVVCPGPVAGRMVAEAMVGHEQDLDRIVRSIPLRRLAEPREVASAIGWLTDPDAGYVTGQVISVSGGVTMH